MLQKKIQILKKPNKTESIKEISTQVNTLDQLMEHTWILFPTRKEWQFRNQNFIRIARKKKAQISNFTLQTETDFSHWFWKLQNKKTIISQCSQAYDDIRGKK